MYASKQMNVATDKSSGFSLIELMVGIAVMAVLLSIALPSFSTMLINSKIRNAAEAALNGLQKARAEAVARNTTVNFVLGAAVADSYSSWTVNVVNPASTIDSRTSSEGSTNVTRTVSPGNATTITFNSLGGVNVVAGQLAAIKFSAVGSSKDLGITIGAGGNARMCDTTLALSDTNPRACPLGWPL